MRAVLLLTPWLLVLALPALEAQAAEPPARLAGPAAAAARPERGFWTQPRVNTAKAVTASLGAALLFAGVALRRAGREHRFRRLRDGALAALALAAALCWTNVGSFHYPGWEHPSELYHYYLGAKYFPELGYTRLYACTALADAEAGVLEPGAARRMRNLETNAVETSDAALAEPQRCKAHFSDGRWSEFRADVDWMRSRVSLLRWARFQVDHGYNATPTWGILGSWLANSGPASQARLRALSLIDPLLLLALFGSLGWAFGWRAMCVALLYWGTCYTGDFGWNGGAFLRQDWLAASVIGICLVRRHHPVAGGFLLATAALLRIFPALLLSGLAARAALAMWRRRALWLSPEQRRILGGGLLAAGLLLPLGAWTGGGFGSWIDFAENSRVHLSTPLLNHLGLRTVLSYDHATRSVVSRDRAQADPVADWKQGRRRAFESRQWLYGLLLAGFAALLVWAVRAGDDWSALVLGVGAIPVAAELTGYYYSILLVYGALWLRAPSVGASLCALSALGWLLAEKFHWVDEIHTWTSLASLAFVAYATWRIGAAGPAGPAERAA